jgi:drug/metabolite transporter (DMT)-like permease
LTLAAFAAVAVIGGGNAIAVKASLGELAPFWSAGLRFTVAGLLLTVFVVLARRPFPRGRSLAGSVAYGAIGFGGAFAFIYPALREVPAGTAMVFLALVPLLTFGLAIAQRQERFHVQGLIGALIAVAGVVIVFADQVNAAVPIVSLLFIIVGTVFIAESGIVLKWIAASDPYATNAVAMVSAAVILVALSAIAGETFVLPTAQETWVAMVYLVLLGSILMFGLYLYAMRRWSASAMSYVTLFVPLVTVPLAAILIGEGISGSFVTGAATVLVGVYIGAFLKVRRRRSPATSLPECLPIDAPTEPDVRPAEPDPRPATRTAT